VLKPTEGNTIVSSNAPHGATGEETGETMHAKFSYCRLALALLTAVVLLLSVRLYAAVRDLERARAERAYDQACIRILEASRLQSMKALANYHQEFEEQDKTIAHLRKVKDDLEMERLAYRKALVLPEAE
jgi:predicted alpha/beta-fold hydrolase